MKFWLLAIRPKTLFAAIGPVLLATALAAKEVQIDVLVFCLTLACALLLQVSVNLANDLFDGISGVDSEQRLGPQRMVQSGKISIRRMKIALAVSIVTAISCGIPLIEQGGWVFLLLGSICIVAALAYSAGPFPLAANALGEVTVFVFFGLIALLGSYYLQTLSLPWSVWPFAIICGLFSTAMMLVNNIRDLETDKQAAKNTLVVYLGKARSHQLYVNLLALALALQLLTLFTHHWSLVLPLCLSMGLIIALIRQSTDCSGAAFNLLLERTAKAGFIFAFTAACCLYVVL